MAEWPPIGKMAAHSAYIMFSKYKYLIVNLGFSHLGVWSGNYFLLVPFPDRCLFLLLIITIPCSYCTPIMVNHCHCSRRMLFFREGRERRDFQWELNNFEKKGSIPPIIDRIVMS